MGKKVQCDSKKNLIANINKRNILLIREKLVTLHPVWNKYQKSRKVDSNVEDLSNYGKEGADWQ